MSININRDLVKRINALEERSVHFNAIYNYLVLQKQLRLPLTGDCAFCGEAKLNIKLYPINWVESTKSHNKSDEKKLCNKP